MAIPFPIGIISEPLSSVLNRVRSEAGSVRNVALRDGARLAAGPVSIKDVLTLLDHLRNAKANLSAAAQRPGIAEFVQTTVNDPTFDVGASFGGMMAAIDAAIAWIVTSFPKDGDGYLLMEKFTADFGRVPRTVAVADTAGLRAALDAIAATILAD